MFSFGVLLNFESAIIVLLGLPSFYCFGLFIIYVFFPINRKFLFTE